jgi:hypothetical protein
MKNTLRSEKILVAPHKIWGTTNKKQILLHKKHETMPIFVHHYTI